MPNIEQKVWSTKEKEKECTRYISGGTQEQTQGKLHLFKETLISAIVLEII